MQTELLNRRKWTEIEGCSCALAGYTENFRATPPSTFGTRYARPNGIWNKNQGPALMSQTRIKNGVHIRVLEEVTSVEKIPAFGGM